MLSTPTPSLHHRRALHRRQNSTPVIFEAPTTAHPLPAMPQRHSAHHHHRRGMSLDQGRPSFQNPFADRLGVYPSQPEGMVSITTHMDHRQLQHPMQVAQPHSSMPQPGSQFQPYPDSSLVPRQPSPQQLKELEDHIKAVYGAHATVQVSILPSPSPAPLKASPITPVDHMDLAPMPPSFDESPCKINVEPPADDPPAFSFNLDTAADSDNGYESSFYSSAAPSPTRSPSLSPQSQSFPTFVDSNRLAPTPQLGPSLFPPLSRSMSDAEGFLSPNPSRPVLSPRAMSIAELNLDATIEDTGISSEEIQNYISEQDPATNRWTCLFPECDKTFGRRENIRAHVQTHLGDRQYRCNHCSKCFVRQHDLKRHAKIHTGDKPYKCPCGAGFARQDALTRHRQRGMCDGAFPNAVRKQARRGRPRKPRPEMEERVEKANKTRKALAYSSSLSSGSSPESSSQSPMQEVEIHQPQFAGLASMHSQSSEESSATSFKIPEEPTTSPFEKAFEKANSARNSPKNNPSPPANKDDDDEDNLNSGETLFRMTAETFAATPPMSPAPSNAGDDDDRLIVPKGPKRNGSPKNPKRSASGRTVSNPFSTPPASPKCGPQSMFGVPELDAIPDFSMFDQSNDLFPDDTMKSMAWMDPI